jgi:hypothetical protein
LLCAECKYEFCCECNESWHSGTCEDLQKWKVKEAMFVCLLVVVVVVFFFDWLDPNLFTGNLLSCSRIRLRIPRWIKNSPSGRKQIPNRVQNVLLKSSLLFFFSFLIFFPLSFIHLPNSYSLSGRARTQKNSGCNHMTCASCKYQWCWLCDGKYSSQHFEVYNPLGTKPCLGFGFRFG